jgi:hypothetical protein
MRSLSTLPRVLAFASLVLAALLIGTPVAEARSAGVSRQVVVSVGSSTFYIDITVDRAVTRCLNGPISVVVSVPDRTRSSVVSVGQGLGRSGIAVSFASGAPAGTVAVSVNVPSCQSSWTEVGVASAAGFATAVPGTTNRPTVVVSYL